jgi:ABC-2 type transport system ATP-binding protein
VSLSVALVGKPEVLILDEPTVGLDPVLRRDLWKMFRGLADTGVTLLVSSHVLDEATRCDRLVILRNGGILADGTLDEVLAETKTQDADAAFLALADRADAKEKAA